MALTLIHLSPSAPPSTCANCGSPIDARDAETGHLCAACALDHELFHRDERMAG